MAEAPPKRAKQLASKTLISRDELSEKATSCPLFTKPKEIGCFTLDGHRNFHLGAKNLRVYRKPPMPLNLADGYPKRYVARDESKQEYIDFILRFLAPKLAAETTILKDVQMIAFRGLFTKIMGAYHAKKDDLQFAVQMYNDCAYMCEFETDEKAASRETLPEALKKASYAGYKFESVSTANPAGEEQSNRTAVVNNNEGVCSVCTVRIDGVKMLIAGEVDCLDETGKHYVELKTCTENGRTKPSFERFKTLKWWAQSFLIGIPTIIAGIRDHNYQLHGIEQFEVSKLPRLARTVHGSWDATTCLHQLQLILSRVLRAVRAEDAGQIIVVHYDKQAQDFKWQVDTTGKFRFLPTWYTHGTVPSRAEAEIQATD